MMPFVLCNAPATFERLEGPCIVWHAVVDVFGLPGRCDFIWRDCVGDIVVIRRGPGTIEQFGIYFHAEGGGISGSYCW